MALSCSSVVLPFSRSLTSSLSLGKATATGFSAAAAGRGSKRRQSRDADSRPGQLLGLVCVWVQQADQASIDDI